MVDLILRIIAKIQIQQNEYKKEPVFIHYGIESVLFYICQKFRYWSTISNVFYVLSSIANGNDISRKILIDKATLRVLSNELQQLYSKYNTSCKYLEILENASLLICNLAGNIYTEFDDNAMSDDDYREFGFSLLLILLKTIQLHDMLKQDTIYILSNIDEKLEIIKYIYAQSWQ